MEGGEGEGEGVKVKWLKEISTGVLDVSLARCSLSRFANGGGGRRRADISTVGWE